MTVSWVSCNLRKAIVIGLFFGIFANPIAADAAQKSTPITKAVVSTRDVQVLEETIGWIEALNEPIISSEVSGQILRVHVEVGQKVVKGEILVEVDPAQYRFALDAKKSDRSRFLALIEDQNRQVTRARNLHKKNVGTKAKLDTAVTHLKTLRADLARTNAQINNLKRQLDKTKTLSPTAGRIEKKLISAGDFVGVGRPLLNISTREKLRVYLPFPEHLAGLFSPGLKVSLTTPASKKVLKAQVSGVRPMIQNASQSLEVLVDIVNPGDWQSGATAKGVVLIDTHEDAFTVPEQSVVRRSVGQVVYKIEGEKVVAQKVTTGLKRGGWVEILTGLNRDDEIALDGAGFLTDGAAISIKEVAQ